MYILQALVNGYVTNEIIIYSNMSY